MQKIKLLNAGTLMYVQKLHWKNNCIVLLSIKDYLREIFFISVLGLRPV